VTGDVSHFVARLPGGGFSLVGRQLREPEKLHRRWAVVGLCGVTITIVD
jgi:hypothetical protein